MLQAEEIGRLENGHAPDPSAGSKGTFILGTLLCPGPWEGRTLAAGEEGGSAAPWREEQAKHPSTVSLQTHVSISDLPPPVCSCLLSALLDSKADNTSALTVLKSTSAGHPQV